MILSASFCLGAAGQGQGFFNPWLRLGSRLSGWELGVWAGN
jgi:hypothetical protein